METIGIMGAMEEETGLYLAEIKDSQKENLSGFTFISGKLSGKNVVVVKSGAGKVNTAICAQMLITRFNVDAIIFTGGIGETQPYIRGKIKNAAQALIRKFDIKTLVINTDEELMIARETHRLAG